MSFDDPSPPSEQPPPAEPSGEPLVPVSSGGEPLVPMSYSSTSGSDIEVSLEYPPELSKGLSLLRWYYVPIVLLAAWAVLIPTFLVLLVLGIGAFVVEIISWFTVLFTKRVPPGLFNYQLMVLRFYLRLIAWMCLMSDEFPLNFAPDGKLTVDLEHPESIPRWRGIPLVSAIMALPQLYAGIAMIEVGFLLVLLPPFIPGLVPLMVLFTGNTNEGIFKFIRSGQRLYARGAAYALMLAPTWEFSMD